MLIQLSLAAVVTWSAWLVGARSASARAADGDAPPAQATEHGDDDGDDDDRPAGLGPPSSGNAVASLACLLGGNGHVLTGVEVLANDGYRAVRGRRVGVVTNPTGKRAGTA